jgi:DNA-binding NarL/FixJ family response regulator
MHPLLLASRTSEPCVLLAHPDVSYRTAVAWYLRQLEWKVTATDSAASVRDWAQALAPQIVLLADRLPDESGYLTCAKLKSEFPECRVLLLAEKFSPEDVRFAEFAGAEGVIRRSDGVKGLAERLMEAVAV